ncbi:MAG: arginine repressor [Oscillospiraceae bacterium]|nr:arginine repressor [Oscillospiraceae bacterium]
MKTKRHQKILELIADNNIDTQEGLLKCLKESHFNVTQATVSRDIKELRLVKALSPEGQYRYIYPQNDDLKSKITSKYHSILQDSITNIDYAGNTVVIKCHVGMANAACAALDSMLWDSVVGTLAGDDTIFALIRTEDKAKEFAESLYKFIGR